jgi:iron complex outermembrane receptor protein
MKWFSIVVFTFLLAVNLPVHAQAADPSGEEQGPASAEPALAEEKADAEDETPEPAPVLDKVVVSAQRLPGEPESLARIPTNVTIITAEEIARSSAETVQELLKSEAGFVAYDQVGNGVQSVVDLRGFFLGNATSVLVDGVRVNEPNDNFASLELLPPLEDIERIEIIRGGASTIYGEGAFAGVINVITKKGESAKPAVTLSSSFGSFETQRHHITGRGRHKDFNYYLGFARNLSDGFRDNSESRESKLFLKLGYEFDERSDISIFYQYVDNHFGQPGALTREELHDDREDAPFNRVDQSEADLNIFSANYRLNFLDEFDLNLNAYRREVDTEVLPTGRLANFFGSAFLTESENNSTGFTAQLQNDREFCGHRNVLTLGFEYTLNEFGAWGYDADLSGAKLGLSSRTYTEEDVYGIFIQDSLNITDALVLTAGVRYDNDDYDFEDKLNPAIDDSERFEEVSPKVGLIYNFDDSTSVYASYSEGFLSPTILQLFAYPGFFSNPDLEPAVSENYEIGLRKSYRDLVDVQLSLFMMDIEDEILFDPTIPPFGINVNRDTKREGVELSATGKLHERIDWFANYTYTDATFEDGIYEDNTIQLVPENRFSAGVAVKLTEHFTFYLDGLYVDEQVLDGDEANEFEELDDYTVFNAKLAFKRGDFTAYIAGRNIFDHEYETRGIIASDPYAGFALVPFYTPAPPASVMVGASYTF